MVRSNEAIDNYTIINKNSIFELSKNFAGKEGRTFSLAAPEAENDRWALNVFHGMRRARKEGRWMGIAPVEYTNKTDKSGRKYIMPKEPEAGIMKWVFQELANNHFAADQIRHWKAFSQQLLFKLPKHCNSNYNFPTN